MSSHHFVKEGQEPALLILDALPYSLTGTLLEWAPLVVVSESAVDQITSYNIKMDVVLSPENRLEELTQKLASQAPVKILSHPAEESPMVNALNFLIRTNQFAVNILTLFPDEVFGQIEQFTDRLQIAILDENIRWSSIPSGNYEKWLVSDSQLFIKKGLDTQSVSTQGLRNQKGSFQSIQTGIISLKSDGLFWVGEPHS